MRAVQPGSHLSHHLVVTHALNADTRVVREAT